MEQTHSLGAGPQKSLKVTLKWAKHICVKVFGACNMGECFFDVFKFKVNRNSKKLYFFKPSEKNASHFGVSQKICKFSKTNIYGVCDLKMKTYTILYNVHIPDR